MFEIDHDFVSLKRKTKQDFLNIWEKCLDNYLEGDWVNAQANISLAQNFFPFDGPCRWMKDYMESHKNIAPESWVGVRDIDMKMELPEYLMIKED